MVVDTAVEGDNPGVEGNLVVAGKLGVGTWVVAVLGRVVVGIVGSQGMVVLEGVAAGV